MNAKPLRWPAAFGKIPAAAYALIVAVGVVFYTVLIARTHALPQPRPTWLAASAALAFPTMLLAAHWRRVGTVAVWLPLFAYAVLCTFAAISMARFGHWPFYAHPDPSDLGVAPLYHVAFVTTLLSLILLPLAPLTMLGSALALVRAHAGPLAIMRTLLKQSAVLILGLCVWGYELGRRSNLVEWLAD